MEPKIENYIEIDGQEILFDSLQEDQKKEIAAIIQDRIMEPLGYIRSTTA